MTGPVAVVFIAPHERCEAIEAWRDRLSPSHIRLIQDAPDDAVIRLYVSDGARIVDIMPQETP